MVSPDKKSYEIAEAFTRYLESKDESLVKTFTREEIEIALLEFIKDGDRPYYIGMQIWRDELKETKNHKREKNINWKNKMTVLIGGLIFGLIVLFLKLIFSP